MQGSAGVEAEGKRQVARDGCCRWGNVEGSEGEGKKRAECRERSRAVQEGWEEAKMAVL